MKATKKVLGVLALVAILSTGASLKAGATGESCTLDTGGYCECFAVYNGGTLIGYKCDYALSDPNLNKCVCNQ
jgi:hypothetical protein